MNVTYGTTTHLIIFFYKTTINKTVNKKAQDRYRKQFSFCLKLKCPIYTVDEATRGDANA